MTRVDQVKEQGAPQYSYFADTPVKTIFTQLDVGNTQPPHNCPHVQFVVTLSGQWFVKTSDGTRHVFSAGDVLFQDNTKDNPAAKKGAKAMHESGTEGDVPCRQLMLFVDRKPEVDNPGPL